jgi:hypothetical protein
MKNKDISMERSNPVIKKVVGPYMNESGLLSPLKKFHIHWIYYPNNIEHFPLSTNGYKKELEPCKVSRPVCRITDRLIC